MKISIITVCYNSEDTIKDTIESVLAQNYRDVEYIIVDGGSTDNTLKIIEGYSGFVSRIISESDEGIYDAMNKGVFMATGEVVGILNSDDMFESDSVLTTIVNEFRSDDNLELVYGNLVFCDAENIHKIRRFYDCSHFQRWKLRYGWMPAHPASFFRKNVYIRLGGYSKDYAISSDYEFFVRAVFVHDIKKKFVDAILVRMRLGGVSTGGLKNVFLLNKEIVRACRTNGVYTNLLFVSIKFPFKLFELLKRPRN